MDPRELALQIVDIVALRPEVEICYMGIANKCFEILESRRTQAGNVWDRRPDSQVGMHPDDGGGPDDEEGEEDEEEAEEDGDAEPGTEDDHVAEAAGEGEMDTESDEDDEDDDDDIESEAGESEAGGRGGARLRLREILFYDDKVAIFKARHGRL